MKTGEVRQFVKITDGRTGAIITNESGGGVLRGHCDIWFGAFSGDGKPVVEQLLIEKEWEVIESPLGRLQNES